MGSKFTAGALLLALILMLTLACSGENPTPAPETERTQQELLDTIDRMDREMEELRQEVEQSNRTRQNDRPDTGKVQATQEPEQTSTTEPAAAPTSEQEPTAEAGRQDLQGICYRTPELQEVILEMLDVRQPVPGSRRSRPPGPGRRCRPRSCSLSRTAAGPRGRSGLWHRLRQACNYRRLALEDRQEGIRNNRVLGSLVRIAP